ncbi:hypothetical protein DESC_740142 [Desulfosarcina cetonica]|nr:hypothetical protein DESC_740142 [Desulfosarcina cetonica]
MPELLAKRNDIHCRQGQPQAFRQVPGHDPARLRHGYGPTQILLARSHTHLRQAAGMDPAKRLHVGIDVQRQAVETHPAPHGNTDAAQFVRADPDAPIGRVGAGRDAPVTGGADHGLLQRGNEFDDLQAMAGKMHDRIDHQLSRPVVGDVATAPGGDHPNAFGGEKFILDAQILTSPTPAEGEDTGVFEDQDHIGIQTAVDLGRHDGQLQIQGRLVIGQRQIDPPASRGI